MKRKILTKMISISLCLTLIASMAMGCGKKEDSSGSESSSSTEVLINPDLQLRNYFHKLLCHL